MFQQSINNQPSVARAGAFCSANPRHSMLSSAGGLLSGPLGVTVGQFAWADSFGVVRSQGGDGRIGFVHEDNISLNTIWLSRTTMQILPNVEMNLFDGGDFWMRFAGGATPGQKVFANFADGSCVAGTAGSPPAAGAVTGSIAPVSITFTGSIAPTSPFDGNEESGVLTVTAATTGQVQIGGIISGTNVVTGTQILSQISGTANGVGTYEVSIAQTVASETITETYGTFTAASGLTGSFAIGDLLGGAAAPAAGTVITAFGTATGGLGTYIVNLTQTVSSGAFTSSAAQETAWYVSTYAAPGELAKTTTQRQV